MLMPDASGTTPDTDVIIYAAGDTIPNAGNIIPNAGNTIHDAGITISYVYDKIPDAGKTILNNIFFPILSKFVHLYDKRFVRNL